jgi:RNA 2',3'-cyclic 3'-phosphodiesterase
MRLFVALDIDQPIRDRIMRFVEGLRNFAPDARWMKPESMHVTLKFIGEQPDAAVESIRQAMAGNRATVKEISFRGYGFFPTPKSARVFWVGIETGPELATLASTIDEKLSALGIPREDRVFSPHLTLARGPGASGSPPKNGQDRHSRTFHILQEKLTALPAPEFGTMTAREFFLYQSQLSPKGSKYTKLARFALG